MSAILDQADAEMNDVIGKSRWSSSRGFVQWEIFFDEDSLNTGVKIPFYERNRVANPFNGRNFEIFYYYVALMNNYDSWTDGVTEFPILVQSNDTIPETKQEEDANNFVLKLKDLEIDDAQLFKGVATILATSQIIVDADGMITNIPNACTTLLNTDTNSLGQLLNKGSPADTKRALDNFLIDMYDCLMQEVIGHINNALGYHSTNKDISITVFDVPSPQAGLAPHASTYDGFVLNTLQDKMADMIFDIMLQHNDKSNMDLFFLKKSAQTVSFQSKNASEQLLQIVSQTSNVAATQKLDELSKFGNYDDSTKILQVRHHVGTASYTCDENFANAASAHPVGGKHLILEADSTILKAGASDTDAIEKTRGIDGALSFWKFLESKLQKDSKIDQRLVCNFRPNNEVKSTKYDRILMTSQLKALGIDSIISMLNEEGSA